MGEISILLSDLRVLNGLRELARKSGMSPLEMAELQQSHARSSSGTITLQISHYAEKLRIPHEEVFKMVRDQIA